MVQLSFLGTHDTDTLSCLDQHLRQRFAAPGARARLDPVSQLILAILGGRTREGVSRAAFAQLRAAFAGWEGVRDAPEPEIFSIIRAVTFPEVKARRIQLTLTLIGNKCGALCLDFLAEMAIEDALVWLETLPGVGRKASAATLNFSTLKRKAMVIDSHHLRVLKRLGLIAKSADTYSAYAYVMTHIPGDWDAEALADHHYYIKRLGQEMCFGSIPVCGGCPAQHLCPSSNQLTTSPIFSAAAYARSAPSRNTRTRPGKSSSLTSSSDNKVRAVAIPALTTLSLVPVNKGCHGASPRPSASRR